MMKYHYALNEIIPFLPYVKKGKYNKNIGTFILVGGSGYKSIYFDKFIVNEDGISGIAIDIARLLRRHAQLSIFDTQFMR